MKFVWNFTEISLKFQGKSQIVWHFSEISLKFQWKSQIVWNFTEISLKFQWKSQIVWHFKFHRCTEQGSSRWCRAWKLELGPRSSFLGLKIPTFPEWIKILFRTQEDKKHKRLCFRYISIIRTNACAFDGGVGRGGLRILHPSLATMNHSCLVSLSGVWPVCLLSLSGLWPVFIGPRSPGPIYVSGSH